MAKKKPDGKVEITIVAIKPFSDALTGLSFDKGEIVPWDIERARHYSDLVRVIVDEPEPEQPVLEPLSEGEVPMEGSEEH